MSSDKCEQCIYWVFSQENHLHDITFRCWSCIRLCTVHNVKSVWTQTSHKKLTWIMCCWTCQDWVSSEWCWFMSLASQSERHHIASLCWWHCCSLHSNLSCNIIQEVSCCDLQSQELKEDAENSWHLNHLWLQEMNTVYKSNSLCQEDASRSLYEDW